jgi:hypothetical protein
VWDEKEKILFRYDKREKEKKRESEKERKRKKGNTFNF